MQKWRYQLKEERVTAAAACCHPSLGGGLLTWTNEVRFDPTPAFSADPTFIHILCSHQDTQRTSDSLGQPEVLCFIQTAVGETANPTNLTFKTSDNCSIPGTFLIMKFVSLESN